MSHEAYTVGGSCLCGAVRFEVRGDPKWAHYCHCSRCRKITGSAFAPNLFAAPDALRFTHGQSHIRTFQLPTAERFQRAFCEICGSNLPFADQTLGMAVIPMGSLDGDPKLAPRAHMFVDSKAPWFEISDSLEQNPGPGPWRPASDE